MTAPTAPRLFEPAIATGSRTANQLGQALAQGYLAMDEYETRLQATFAAHTTAELRQLVADLPLDAAPPQRSAAPGGATSARPAAACRSTWPAYLAMVVIVLTVWLAVGLTAGAWYFWPIWPILGAGIGAASATRCPDSARGCLRLCHARPAIDGRSHVRRR